MGRMVAIGAQFAADFKPFRPGNMTSKGYYRTLLRCSRDVAVLTIMAEHLRRSFLAVHPA